MDIVEKFVDVITRKDIEGFGSMYTEDAVIHEPLTGMARGRAEITAGEQMLFTAFSDVTIDVRNRFESGNTTVAEVVLKATNDGPLDLGAGEVVTNRSIEVPMVWVIETNDQGLVTEERDYFDTGLIMQQLGFGEG